MRKGNCSRFLLFAALAVTVVFAAPAQAQVEPDPTTCDGFDCESLPDSICDPGGFQVSLTNYVAADDPMNMTGNAIYTYQICSPPPGTCSGNPARSCLSHDDCEQHGEGECSRECAVDTFRGLSHFNVDFPDLGGESCLSENNFVGGTCTCVPEGGGCSVSPNVVLGDGSCYDGQSTVAKCDGTELPPGSCIQMELQIAGESNFLGLGTAVVVSKESGDCNESCLAGPSCDRCDIPPPPDGDCLTRTIGFWGTHPWITNDYAPVTVCGESVGCSGADDGQSNPSCPAGSCDSIMEALGSNGGELKNGSSYIALIRQLTAAKLNLAANDDLGGFCADFIYGGKSIQAWVEACEAPALCAGSQSQISGSGCIEALDAFNNSGDSIPQPPAPFDQPPIDDHGNVSGADPGAWGDAKNSGYVIGKNVPGGANCNN